jgi:Flp pilus assembly protein TadD
VRYLIGDLDATVRHCRRILDLDPQYGRARELLGVVYLRAGKSLEAVAELESASASASHTAALTASLAHARAVTGDEAAARRLLVRLQRADGPRYVSQYSVALAHVGLGDADAAFASLERATADCDPALAFVAVEPRFEPVRADPRYDRLIDLLGLG